MRIGFVVAAHSSLSQLLQFDININTMILCGGNNIHYTMLYYAIPKYGFLDHLMIALCKSQLRAEHIMEYMYAPN